jgi:hypothetical protein
MWTKAILLFIGLTFSPPVIAVREVRYHEVMVIGNNSGRIISELNALLASSEDEERILTPYYNLIYDIPPGFYLDTLTNKLFYNDCVIDQPEFKLRTPEDINRFIRIRQIDRTGRILPLNQKVTIANFRRFFRHKINIDLLSGKTLYSLEDGKSTSFTRPDRALIDLDGDKEKERVSFMFNYEGDDYFNEFKIVFAKKRPGGWRNYDTLTFRTYSFENHPPKLESNLEKVALMKIFAACPPVLFINTTSRNDRGWEAQSQVLLMAR